MDVPTVKYSIEVEVVEGEKCHAHRSGDKFAYPRDSGRMCPWLLDRVGPAAGVLPFGGSAVRTPPTQGSWSG